MPHRTAVAFTSAGAFTLQANSGKTWDGTLEYSTDGTSWTVWDGAQIAAAAGGSEYTLLLRGTGNTVITGSDGNTKYWKLNGSDIACAGNIENLLDHTAVTNGNHPTMGDDCFSWLFSGCAALTSAPELPATALSDGCYMRMLSGTGITKAPALPATALKSKCYSTMFADCAALTEAPALPATALAYECYSYMFLECTALTDAPDLPATTLANSCCSEMFFGCTGIAMSETQDSVYTEPWTIPAGADRDADGAPFSLWNGDMLRGTGGPFTGNPECGVTYYQKHSHRWAAAWTGDDTAHWHECEGNCPVTDNSQKDAYGAHRYADDADATCNTCGYTREVAPPEEEVPETGDGSRAALWLALSVLSLAGLAGALVLRRRLRA